MVGATPYKLFLVIKKLASSDFTFRRRLKAAGVKNAKNGAGRSIDSFLHSLFGYRCNQLPLIERLPQWLSGPFLPLPVAAAARWLPYQIQMMFGMNANYSCQRIFGTSLLTLFGVSLVL
jgi:hypothetical protein